MSEETGTETGQDFDWAEANIVVDKDIGLSEEEIVQGLRNSPEVAAISNWVQSINSYTTGRGHRKGSIVYRDAYVTPEKVFDQFRLAAYAAEEDDTVSGVIESTESLAFSKVKFDHEDQDQEDVWNQLGKIWDLDSLLRKCWRDLFIYSQFIIAAQPGTRNLSVRGKSKKGNKKRKEFKGLKVPVAFRLMDPTTVVPYGNYLFGGEKLAYLAKDRDEAEAIDASLANPNSPDPVRHLLIRKLNIKEFSPDKVETLSSDYIGSYYAAYEMNPANVYRHTETKPDYASFAPVKMKSIFPILDMKTQLRANDRATLIGATNFIVLIKKGSDANPAKPAELNALKGYAKSLAKMPLLIGDHRLSVEIVTPPVDHTLTPERYNTLKSDITSRLYGLYSAGNYGSGTKSDDSAGLTRMAAKNLESRRHMVKRAIEKFIIDPIILNNQDQLDDSPDLRYQPASIALEFDAARSSFMLELRARGEISRETILTEFDFDQDDEARRVEFEKENYKVFDTINPNNQGVPGSGGAADTKNTGRVQGGAAPGTGQGKPARNTTNRSD